MFGNISKQGHYVVFWQYSKIEALCAVWQYFKIEALCTVWQYFKIEALIIPGFNTKLDIWTEQYIKCCCYLVLCKFEMLSIIGNIGNRFWLMTICFDWLQNILNYCLNILIDCQISWLMPKILIYCQKNLIDCQKFPTRLITSLKHTLESTLDKSTISV